MNRNVLSELNPSWSDLISTSYFSFLSCYGYMVITIPLHLCFMCVWGGGHVYVVYEDTNLYNDMGIT